MGEPRGLTVGDDPPPLEPLLFDPLPPPLLFELLLLEVEEGSRGLTVGDDPPLPLLPDLSFFPPFPQPPLPFLSFLYFLLFLDEHDG